MDKKLDIGEKCFNQWTGDLIIKNYPNLQSIAVKQYSMRNLNSLKICDCENLKTIKVDTYSFDCLPSLIIDSI